MLPSADLLGIRVTDKDNVPRGTLLLSVTHGDYAHTPWGWDYLFAVRFNACACCDTPFSPAATLFMVPRYVHTAGGETLPDL